MNSKIDPLKPMRYTSVLPWRWGWFCGLNCDPCATKSIAAIGESITAETELLLSLLSPGDTVLDVGANVGTLAIPFARKVGNLGRVICFEPQKVAYMCLCANVALNSLIHNVHPIQAAAGSEPGTVLVPFVDVTLPEANLAAFSLLDECKSGQQVQRLTIDMIGLDKCRLIKADVEGMEADVLWGAAETIKRCQPVIWAEQLDAKEGSKERLRAALAEFEYKAWKLQTPAYVPRNARGEPLNPLGIYGDTDPNVFAIHKDVAAPDWTTKAEVFLA